MPGVSVDPESAFDQWVLIRVSLPGLGHLNAELCPTVGTINNKLLEMCRAWHKLEIPVI